MYYYYALLYCIVLRLLVSIYEVLPKDKRAKEEKTHLLGISHLDLLPIIQGNMCTSTYH